MTHRDFLADAKKTLDEAMEGFLILGPHISDKLWDRIDNELIEIAEQVYEMMKVDRPYLRTPLWNSPIWEESSFIEWVMYEMDNLESMYLEARS